MSTVDELTALIVQKGEDIRALKASGAAKDALMPHVNELLQLKEKLVISCFYCIRCNILTNDLQV